MQTLMVSLFSRQVVYPQQLAFSLKNSTIFSNAGLHAEISFVLEFLTPNYTRKLLKYEFKLYILSVYIL